MNALPLEDGPIADNFFPFSLTRSMADIRCGILTLREKWNYYLKELSLPANQPPIPANLIASHAVIRYLLENKPLKPDVGNRLTDVTDILRFNDVEIRNDFELITRGRLSSPISATNRITGTAIFIEPGAIVEHAYLNASEGPIYIGRDSVIMEGVMIRGPFAIGEKSVVKMGAKIYGATSTGPQCILGGEIKNSVIFGYSNKAHDGYLGDSVLGEWCNLGAGTSNSNLKNSGGEVKFWNPIKNMYVKAGQKAGLLMGDYSRSAIQTSFNTGTVIGVCSHVFGNGPTPPYLPSFHWGTGETYVFEKAIEHIRNWKKFKGCSLDSTEIEKLKIIFDQQKN